MTADIIEHRRDFLFGKLLDQSEQLFPLHAHDPSVRSKVQPPGFRAVSGTYPIVTAGKLVEDEEWQDTKISAGQTRTAGPLAGH